MLGCHQGALFVVEADESTGRLRADTCLQTWEVAERAGLPDLADAARQVTLSEWAKFRMFKSYFHYLLVNKQV